MLQKRNECCNIMVIRRQNFAWIMENYFMTLIEKFLKKNVAILFSYIVKMIRKMAVEFCLNNQIYVATIKRYREKDLCLDKRKLCYNRKWKSNETCQDKFVTIKTSMFQQTVHLATKIKEGNMP